MQFDGHIDTILLWQQMFVIILHEKIDYVAKAEHISIKNQRKFSENKQGIWNRRIPKRT